MNTHENTTESINIQTVYPKYMKPHQAAKYLNISYDHLMLLRREGKIRAKNFGGVNRPRKGTYRFRQEDLDAYMAKD